MVHSIELLFDDETEATLRRIWDDLSAADLPSRTPAGRPHVSERLGPGVVPVQVLVRDRAEGLQQVGAEQPPLFSPLQRVRVSQQPGQQVGAVHPQPA